MMTERHVILIVDDTPENLVILGDMLEQEGHGVLIATSGLKALEIVRVSPHPELVLLDIMMPDMDGYEVCRQLKADSELKMIPVIFISALGMQEQKIRAFREGAVDYITKPFMAEEVVHG
jgi:CheY-like chemotaxis protein